MKKQALVAAILVMSLMDGSALAEVATVTGDISSVIVYRGQALVTRTINIDLPQGSSEFTVNKLPAKIVPESLYAQTSGNVTVLSVRYHEKAVKEDTREEVKQLEGQIESTKNKIRHIDRNHKHGGNLWRKYDTIWKLAVDASNADLNRGLLQSEQIESLTQYLEDKWNALHEKALELEDTKAEFEKELELLKRRRKELDAGWSPTERQAVVFINKTDNKPATIELNYLVNGATWIPQYNLRADPGESTALIEYNALLNQTSGEDWPNVSLALSTAQPAMVAAPPALEPMKITLRSRDELGQAPMPSGAAQQAMQQQVDFRDRQAEFGKLLRSRRFQAKRGKAAQRELSQIALDNQMLEFVASSSEVQKFKKEMAKIKRTEGVSVTYNLPGRLTLPSRSDQQLVSIASILAKADLVFVATPLLTDYVYLQGELLNNSNHVLLPGQAAMFRNGEFTGKGQIPLVTIGQKFTTGFGVDSQIQVSREFDEKKTDTLWGNRVDENHYRIAISNYKNTPVKLQLFDRLPYTENEDLQIYGFETSTKLSTDAEYLRTARKKGILRWDLSLKPDTIGKRATIVTYSFTMKYDNDMQIKPMR